MSKTKLAIGFGEYDRTRVMADGTVKIEGVDAEYHSNRIVTEVFRAMVKDRAFDVAELGLSYFLRTMEFDDPPFLAIPAFPNRCFRHSAIYINVGSGIKKPEDLAGKTVGELAMYSHDAGVWPKGILSDDFGVKPEQCRWVTGRLDWPMKPVDFVPHTHPPNVEVKRADDTDLGALLESGEIDALISADVPKCFLEKSPKVARLFPDYVSVERDYYRRTGIFPIMHAFVVRKELAKEPELLKSVYRALCAAKDTVREQYTKGMIFNNMNLMIPWLSHLLNDDMELLGADWWPYGLKANRKAVDTFLRYHHEQGLSRRFTCEDIFVPMFLES